jgi:hypothetical protein
MGGRSNLASRREKRKKLQAYLKKWSTDSEELDGYYYDDYEEEDYNQEPECSDE